MEKGIRKHFITLKLAVVAVFMLTSQISLAQLPDSVMTRRPRIGLTFAGGGAKGAAHIGVLKVLEEVGIPVDYVTGTSMGSIIGMLYSLGYSADQMQEIINNVDWGVCLTNRVDLSYTNAVVSDNRKKYLLDIPFNTRNVSKKLSSLKKSDDMAFQKSLPGGFSTGSNLLNLFNSLSVGYQDSMDFKDLPVPFACVVSDIVSGQQKVLRSGRLPDAVRASMAIPGVFEPVQYGNDMKLVDGGLFNNFPVDVCQQMGADIIIGVEVTKDRGEVRSDDIQSLPDLLTRLFDMMTRKGTYENQQRCAIYIHPDISGFGTLSFSNENINAIIERGYKAASEKREMLEALKEQLDKFPLEEVQRPAPALNMSSSSKTEVIISSCSIEGLDADVREKLVNKSGINFFKPVTGKDIEKLASIIYGTGAFKSINYYLHPQENGSYALEFKTVASEPHSLAAGLRADSQDAVSLLLHLGFNENILKGWTAKTTWQLGSNIAGNATLSYSSWRFPTFNLAGNFRLNENLSSLFGESVSSSIKQELNLELFASQYYSRFTQMELGARIERRNILSIFYDNEYISSQLKRAEIDASYDIRGVFTGSKDKFDNTPMSLFFRMKFDNMDSKTFPRKGLKFTLSGDWYFAELNAIARKDGISKPHLGDLMFNFESCIPLGGSLVLKPQLYSRALMGNNCFEEHYYLYRNHFGGSMPGRYFQEQLPFVGINTLEIGSALTTIFRTDLQWHISGNHYLTGIYNYDREADDPAFWLDSESCVHNHGAGIEYAYDSFLGPISLNVHWSNVTAGSFWKQLGLYFNIGYNF